MTMRISQPGNMLRPAEALAGLLLLAVAVAAAEDGVAVAGVGVGVDEHERYLCEQVYHGGNARRYMAIDSLGVTN